MLERNRRYVNLSPYGEPQLGKRGLYDSLGGRSDAKQAQMAMLWVLNLSDGEHSLLDIAERAGLPFDTVAAAADALHDAGSGQGVKPVDRPSCVPRRRARRWRGGSAGASATRPSRA